MKIEYIIQSRLWWYGHVMRGDIKSQIREVKEVEIIEKEEGWTNEIVGRVCKEGYGTIWVEKSECVQSKMARANYSINVQPWSLDNGIKRDVVVVTVGASVMKEKLKN